jgi:integrase
VIAVQKGGYVPAFRASDTPVGLKGKPRNVPDVGKQLAVDYILEGAILRSDRQLRIHVQFVREEKKGPLFRSVDRHKKVTLNPMTRTDVLRMVKRRALAAGLPYSTCCHTFRATGITAYLENGGTIENAQAIAAHESPRTTKLYDRTSDEITLDEVERIAI